VIGEVETNWKLMVADLDSLSRDHAVLGTPAAFVAKNMSLAEADRHFVAAYERFAERLVNALDQTTRNLAILEGGNPTDVENVGGPGMLRMAGRLSGVKGADLRLEQAATLRIDLQHHYGAVRATELYRVVDDLCGVLKDVLRGLRPRLVSAGAQLPPVAAAGRIKKP
jgi:hypothetical protein